DNAVIGFRGDRELARQRLPFHNERVIAGGRERVGQLAEDIFPVVMNLAGFTMEKFRSADDFSAKSCTNGLVAEANTEDWKFSGKSYASANPASWSTTSAQNPAKKVGTFYLPRCAASSAVSKALALFTLS